MLQCRSVTSVLFVLVYMKVVPEPNNVSDCIEAFLDDPQWLKHIKDPSTKANRGVNFFEYLRILGIFLVYHSCSLK